MKRYILIIISVALAAAFSSCTSSKTAPSDDYMKIISSKDKKLSRQEYLDNQSVALDHFINAAELRQKGEIEQSILEYQLALKYDSAASIEYAIAQSFFEIFRFEQAIDYLKSSLRHNNDFIEAEELLVKCYTSTHQFEPALTLLKKLHENNPTLEYKATMAWLYENLDINKAIEVYEEIASETDNLQVLTKLSMLYNNIGNKEKYLHTLERMYKLSPTQPRNALNIISNYLENGYLDKSLSFLEGLQSELEGDNLLQAHVIVGDYLIRSEEEIPKSILRDYLKLTAEKFDDKWQINLINAYLYSDLGDSTEAKAYFTRASEQTIESVPEVTFRIAMHYYAKSNLDLATFFMQKAREAKSDEWMYWHYSALLASEMNDDSLAIEYLDSALALDSTNIEIWTQLGLSHNKLRNWEQSDSAYRRALELDPSSALVNNNLAYSLAERDTQLNVALQMSNLAIEAEPGNIAFIDTYAYINHKLGNLDTALKYYLKAADMSNISGEILEHLGDLYFDMGEKNKALDSYQKALKLEPERSSAQQKIKMLEGS